eukprot:4142582-Pleurochrysis_carterae.AAC.2
MNATSLPRVPPHGNVLGVLEVELLDPNVFALRITQHGRSQFNTVASAEIICPTKSEYLCECTLACLSCLWGLNLPLYLNKGSEPARAGDLTSRRRPAG